MKKNLDLSSSLYLGIFFFILIFPKAGFKLGSIPISLGYVFLGLYSLYSIFRFRFEPSKESALFLLAWIPFQIVIVIHFIFYPPQDIGYFISLVVNFIFFPYLFYGLFPKHSSQDFLIYFIKYLRMSIFLVCLYGIVLFFYKIIFGEFLEIPGLTSNFSDYGTLEETKFIDRGGIYKLISTYGNGNLFGICIMFFYPLFLTYEPSILRRWTCRIALVLTLSRTIWIGLIIAEIIHLFILPKIKKTISVALLLLMIFSANRFMESFQDKNNFLLDASLGGRDEQLHVFNNLTFIGAGGFDGIYEMVFLGILKSFGVLGLFTFTFAAIFPLIYSLFKPNTIIQKQLLIGIFLYGILSISDGAILLIPVMYFYYFSNNLVIYYINKI